ncbi:hypothetical protein COU59_01055 [Candidatus Pacearchaeota archaeon CG10_big_fil_rev_8_21_14_0_10_34_12]|nr:MAG: hypothetical protein COU59_01055 [Candidatus Pacearchaeota archaeon CG10_big_fil_rev_8_21_14_0_10_34_12]
MTLGKIARSIGFSLSLAGFSSGVAGDEILQTHSDDGKWIYASSVDLRNSFIGTGSKYSDFTQALGPPSISQSFSKAVTLGEGGYITLNFNGCASNGKGYDLEIIEISRPEAINVRVSSKNSPGHFVDLGIFKRPENENFFRIDLDNFGINHVGKVQIGYAGEKTFPPYNGPDVDSVKLRSCGFLS